MEKKNGLRGARGFQLLLLMVAITTAVYAKVALGPLQETMRNALSLSDHRIALLQGPALALSMAVLAVPLGLLIDRYMRVRLLLVCMLLVTIGTVLTAVAADFHVLFAARALVGLGAFPMQPIVLSLIADLFAPAERGRASMITLIGQYVAFSAVFAIGGTLVARFGDGPDAWRWAMLWMVGPLLAMVLPAMFALREPPRTERNIERPSVRQSFREIWQYRAVIVTLTLGGIVKLIPLHSALIWAAPAFSRGFALSADRVGMIMAIALPVGGIAGSLIGGLLADSCQRAAGPRRTILAIGALALLCAPLGLFALTPDAVTAAVLLTLMVLGITAVAQMSSALASVVIPNELRGLYFAVQVGVGAVLGVGMAPVLVSTVSDTLGGPTMLHTSLSMVCVIGCVLCAAVYALGARYFPVTRHDDPRGLEQCT